MKTCYFDCFSGISGDMTVGALIDAGADFDAIKEGLKSLGVEGYTVSAEKVLKNGVHATQFRVHDHGHEHHHDHDHEHTHTPRFTPIHSHEHKHVLNPPDIEKLITGSSLPQAVKDAANATFLALGEAEASVHGTTIDQVHFHEVGAVDSIVDIVASQIGFHLLGIERFACSPLHVGSGTVKCDHGIMPVPAPATARLLQGIPTYGGAVDGELVTPTGAAIIRHRVTEFGPAPLMRTLAIGYGSGTKNLADRANVLRVTIGESGADAGRDTIQILEANLDDMSGELLAPLVTDGRRRTRCLPHARHRQERPPGPRRHRARGGRQGPAPLRGALRPLHHPRRAHPHRATLHPQPHLEIRFHPLGSRTC
jgi:uncharacterized protein (TIGR00299 family) protein